MELLAVNRFDDPARVNSFIAQFNLKMPVALNGQGANDGDKAYGIEGSPTGVVIAPDGTVVAVMEGEDSDALMNSLAKLGFRG